MSDLAASGIVYSGPHYGRTHKILRRQNNLIWVSYRGDTFAVPYCDVEMLPCDRRAAEQQLRPTEARARSCG